MYHSPAIKYTKYVMRTECTKINLIHSLIFSSIIMRMAPPQYCQRYNEVQHSGPICRVFLFCICESPGPGPLCFLLLSLVTECCSSCSHCLTNICNLFILLLFITSRTSLTDHNPIQPSTFLKYVKIPPLLHPDMQCLSYSSISLCFMLSVNPSILPHQSSLLAQVCNINLG